MTTQSLYAEGTTVSEERSRAEIERTLTKYGADQFMYGWSDDTAVVQFSLQGRMCKILVPMPSKDDHAFWKTPKGRDRTEKQAHAEYDQERKRRWRSAALVIKALLDAAATGIMTLDQVLMAFILLPDGRTVGDFMVPQIEQAYETGKMPLALPGMGGTTR